MKPLNPGLFSFMQERFDTVRIANQGIPLRWHFEESSSTTTGRDVAVSPGHEHYVTFCPVCNYHRPTLWVSYMFLQKVNLGTPQNPMEHHFLHLACCYHCHCEDDRRGIIPRAVRNLGVVLEKRPSSELLYHFETYFDRLNRLKAGGVYRGPKEFKGPLVERIPLPKSKLLTELPPQHEALQYLAFGRETPVDPTYLSEVYGVRYCDHYVPCDGPGDVTALTHQRAYNRLIFPFYRDGELVTWQMRVCQRGDTRQRWLFPPGQGQHFYGWDFAKEYHGVILLEGVFDCYAAGPSGLGICTSNLNLRRCKEIAEQWDYVVIALDPKEFQTEIVDGDGRKRVGHAYVVQERLKQAGLRFPPALLAYPPECVDDPSALGPERFDQILRQSLDRQYYRAVRSLTSESI